MTYAYIDIHSHLNLPEFDTDREEIISELKAHNIATITVGVDYATSRMALELAKQHDHLFACVGMHPTDNQTEVFDYDQMYELAQDSKVVAIGECGFDYFREKSPALESKQRALFEMHVELAVALGKPLMIHARPQKGSMDAYEDALDVLARALHEHPNLKANFHFFVGDTAIASQIVALGCTVSFDGPITFARDYDEVIRMLPLESIMAETDAPFAAPVPYRGKRCTPLMVSEVVKKIAEIKGLPESDVAQAIIATAKRVFDI